MKNRLLYTLLFILVGLVPTNIFSQHRWEDPDYVKAGKPFMMSRNPGGLLWMDRQSLSEVRIGFDKNNGGLVNYHQSGNAYRIAADAASIYRINDRIVLRGGLDYSYAEGQDMSGSVFLDPYYNAFDFCEFDDSFRGRKKTERYDILAEIGCKVYKGLILGASFNLSSANYSKMKDLRHANTYSDMKLGLSLTYSFSDLFSMGATYHYRKSVEGLYFKRYSPTEKIYDMLIGYGHFWGKRKTYDEYNGQIAGMENPMKNVFNGGSLQFNISPSEKFTLFMEGYFLYRKGSYGLESPSTILFNTFNGYEGGASLNAVFTSGDNRHVLSFRYGNSSTHTYESVYKVTGTPSGTNTVIYYDPIQVGGTSYSSYGLEYRGDWAVRDRLPLWSFTADADVTDLQKEGTLYPYYRKSQIAFCDIDLGLVRNFLLTADQFTAGLHLGYRDGLTALTDDGSYIQNPTQMKPRVSEMMQGRELEYFTKAQLVLAPSFRYTRRFRKLSAYADFSYSWRKALEKTTFLQDDQHHTFSISLGILL